MSYNKKNNHLNNEESTGEGEEPNDIQVRFSMIHHLEHPTFLIRLGLLGPSTLNPKP